MEKEKNKIEIGTRFGKLIVIEDLGLKESGLDRLIMATYSLLGLATYFTAGEKEVLF